MPAKKTEKKIKNAVDSIPETARKTYHDHIWVDEDETIYYVQNGIYKKATKYFNKTKRPVVVICDSSYYVSRLIAEALLENPYGKSGVVTFKNDDPTDIRKDNIKWAPKGEISRKTIKKMQERPHDMCTKCGKVRIIASKSTICVRCQKKLEEEKILIKKKEDLLKKAETLRKASKLTKKQQEVIDLYEEGYSYSEMARILGVSRQSVQQKLGTIEKKLAKMKSEKFLAADEIAKTIKSDYKRSALDIPYKTYEEIYRYAATKTRKAYILTKRVIKKLDSYSGLKYKEMVDIESKLLEKQQERYASK